jgi:predicted Zn-dependent protease
MARTRFLIAAGIASLALIAHAAAPAMAATGIVRDEEIETALRGMSRQVFEEAGVSPAAVKFILVQDDDLNAFVAGGQNIFINTGLILKTENASELVGVIAHETGHIALGHLFRMNEAMENISFQAMLAGVLGMAAAVASGSGEAGAAITTAGRGMAVNAMLSHTRGAESSADEAGTRFLAAAGYPVTGFLTFMEKLEDQELLPSSQQSPYARTHPLTQDRIDFLKQKVAAQKNAVPPTVWAALHARMKAKLTGFLYPDRALQNRADTTDANYAKAIARYRKGDIDKALPLVESIIKDEPQNPYFQELKGQMLFETGRVAEALPPYALAVKYAPQSGLIRAAYGHALLEAGRDAEAVKQLELSLDTEPRQPGTHRKLGIAYGKMGQEGVSRLHLAEEYLLLNKPKEAKAQAQLALAKLPAKSAARLRAQDLLGVADRNIKKKDQQED